MAHMTTVFLSSTSKDLQPWRDAVAEAIGKLSGFHCVRMEDFGAVDAEPVEVCRRKVAESDVFVGLVGHLKGSAPEGSDSSFTQIEYEEAKRTSKPRLLFVANDDFPLPAKFLKLEAREAIERQLRFREQVKRERSVVFFDEPQKLATLVVAALRNQKETAGRAEPNPPGAIHVNLYSGLEAQTVKFFPAPEDGGFAPRHAVAVPVEAQKPADVSQSRNELERVRVILRSLSAKELQMVSTLAYDGPQSVPKLDPIVALLIHARLIQLLGDGRFGEEVVDLREDLKDLIDRHFGIIKIGGEVIFRPPKRRV